MNLAAAILPDDLTVLEAAEIARAHNLHLITDGRRVVVSPIVPPGWHRLAVRIKTASPPELEVLPCAA